MVATLPLFEGLLATYDSLCRTIFAQFEALVQQSATSRVVEALVAHARGGPLLLPGLAFSEVFT